MVHSNITSLIIDSILFYVEIAVTPKIDLAVIMGALSNPTLNTMKDATKVIIDQYGTKHARYSLITCGREASTKIDFTDGFKTAQDFKNAVNAVQRPEGSPDLKKALDQAMKLFEDAPPRPDAKKILVVLIDQKSVNYPQVLSASAKSLQDKNILVLPIAFGSLADLDELTRLAPSKGVVIQIDGDEDGAAIAQKIMNDGVKGKYSLLLFSVVVLGAAILSYLMLQSLSSLLLLFLLFGIVTFTPHSLRLFLLAASVLIHKCRPLA